MFSVYRVLKSVNLVKTNLYYIKACSILSLEQEKSKTNVTYIQLVAYMLFSIVSHKSEVVFVVEAFRGAIVTGFANECQIFSVLSMCRYY